MYAVFARIYRCVCCGTELFDASTSHDSPSGWPSFHGADTPGLVGYHGDNNHGMVRVETTCNASATPTWVTCFPTQTQRSALPHQRPGTGESMSSEKVGFAGSSQGLQVSWERPDHAPLQALAVFAHCFTCGKNSLAATCISRALAQQHATLRFDFTGLGESEGGFGRGGFSSSVADIVAAVHWMQSTMACLHCWSDTARGGGHRGGCPPRRHTGGLHGAPGDGRPCVSSLRSDQVRRGWQIQVLSGRPGVQGSRLH